MTKTAVPTKAELLAHLADRENDLPRPGQDLTPPWVEDREDHVWRHIRERERRITMLTTRLDKARTGLDRAWGDRAYDLEP